jgi:hypothetical protein
VISDRGLGSETAVADLPVRRVGRTNCSRALNRVTHDGQLTPGHVADWLSIHEEIDPDSDSEPLLAGNFRLFVARQRGASPVLAGEFGGREPSQCAMGTRLVIVLPPRLDLALRIGE